MSIHTEVIPKTNLLRFGKSLTSLLVFVLSRALAMSPAARVDFDIKVLGGVVSRAFPADIELVSERGVLGSCLYANNKCKHTSHGNSENEYFRDHQQESSLVA
jgi:hypothetical protein